MHSYSNKVTKARIYINIQTHVLTIFIPRILRWKQMGKDTSIRPSSWLRIIWGKMVGVGPVFFWTSHLWDGVKSASNHGLYRASKDLSYVTASWSFYFEIIFVSRYVFYVIEIHITLNNLHFIFYLKDKVYYWFLIYWVCVSMLYSFGRYFLICISSLSSDITVLVPPALLRNVFVRSLKT